MTSSTPPLEQHSNEIANVLKKYKNSFMSIGIFSAVINLLMLVPSIYMLQVYDRVLASANEFTLLMLTALALGLYGLMGILEYIRAVIAVQIGLKFDEELSSRVYKAAFEKKLSGHKANASQSLQDLDNLRRFLTGTAIIALFDAPWFPIYLAVMFLFDFWIGILALAGAIILVFLAWVNQRWNKRLLSESSQLSIASNLTINNQLQHAETIQAMGMLNKLNIRWKKLHRAYLHKQSIASDRISVISSFSKTFRITLQSLVLGLGAYLVIEGRISAGMMIAGSILMGRVLAPIDQIIAAWKQWVSTRLSYQQLIQLLQQFPEQTKGMLLPEPTGRIQIEQVSAVPPQGHMPTLIQFSAQIEAGTIIGIVGASGAGKSTLARVLTGIWTPRIGVIRFDGANIQDWEKEQLGSFIGYLPQDVELFAGTVAENISRFAEPDALKVIEAAKLANVHELILRLPQGYDTPLGDFGQGLSGGQRQRVALARALYGLPKVVVLDEPNSNLDEAGEKALMQAIEHLKTLKITVFLITHKPQILASTDRLFVLDQGQLKLDGQTQEVLKSLNAQSTVQKPTSSVYSKQQSSKGGVDLTQRNRSHTTQFNSQAASYD